MESKTQKIDLYEFIDKLVKLEALDLAPAATLPRNEARSAPMNVTAPQAARDSTRALLQLKKDNVAGFVVEWCALEGASDVAAASDVAVRALGGIALKCWGHGFRPEYFAHTRPMTCVADTHSREEGSGTLTVSAIEGAQMAAMDHSHSVFIDCRGDTTKGRRGQCETYSLQRTQNYFHIAFDRLSKIGKRDEFEYSEEFENTIAPALSAIRGQQSLCHSISGASRSIGFVAGVLVGAAGLEPREAFAYLHEVRGNLELGAMDAEHADALSTLLHYKHRWRRLCGEMGLTATIRRVLSPNDAKDLFLDALSQALAATAHRGTENAASDEDPTEEKPAAGAKRDHGRANLHVIAQNATDDCEDAHQAVANALQTGSVAQGDEKPPRREMEPARGGACHGAGGAHDALTASVEDGGVGQEGQAPTPSSHEFVYASDEHNPWTYDVWEDDDEECWNCGSAGRSLMCLGEGCFCSIGCRDVWHHENPYADHGARGWPEAWEVAGHGASSSTAAAFDVD